MEKQSVSVLKKSVIAPYQRWQSSSGLHRPGGGREDSLLPSSLSASGAGRIKRAWGRTVEQGSLVHRCRMWTLWCLVGQTHERNLVVEGRVTEFLPEGVQSLLNDLLPVGHGERSQGKQHGAFLLGQGLEQRRFGYDAHDQTNTLTRRTQIHTIWVLLELENPETQPQII